MSHGLERMFVNYEFLLTSMQIDSVLSKKISTKLLHDFFMSKLRWQVNCIFQITCPANSNVFPQNLNS